MPHACPDAYGHFDPREQLKAKATAPTPTAPQETKPQETKITRKKSTAAKPGGNAPTKAQPSWMKILEDRAVQLGPTNATARLASDKTLQMDTDVTLGDCEGAVSYGQQCFSPPPTPRGMNAAQPDKCSVPESLPSTIYSPTPPTPRGMRPPTQATILQMTGQLHERTPSDKGQYPVNSLSSARPQPGATPETVERLDSKKETHAHLYSLPGKSRDESMSILPRFIDYHDDKEKESRKPLVRSCALEEEQSLINSVLEDLSEVCEIDDDDARHLSDLTTTPENAEYAEHAIYISSSAEFSGFDAGYLEMERSDPSYHLLVMQGLELDGLQGIPVSI